MFTVLLPPGVYPIAVKYIVSYHINSKQNIGRRLYSTVTSFVKIGAVGSVLFIILLKCLSDLTKIPYWGYLHSTVKLVQIF